MSQSVEAQAQVPAPVEEDTQFEIETPWHLAEVSHSDRQDGTGRDGTFDQLGLNFLILVNVGSYAEEDPGAREL